MSVGEGNDSVQDDTLTLLRTSGEDCIDYGFKVLHSKNFSIAISNKISHDLTQGREGRSAKPKP